MGNYSLPLQVNSMTDDERRELLLWMATASRSGRIFIVSGYKGKKGHSWSIIDGKANRPYFPPYRYILHEVTA